MSSLLENQCTRIPRMPVSPWLNVRRSAEALEFYKAAFGATEHFRLDSPDGIVARLAIDDTEFWLSDEEPQHGNFSPETLNGSTVRLILVVKDVDAAFARALAAGARLLCPVAEDHGWRVGRVADPYGHQWEIARKI